VCAPPPDPLRTGLSADAWAALYRPGGIVYVDGSQPAPVIAKAPATGNCRNCGAPRAGEPVCSYCGTPL
jgi:hypothetical protein